MTNSKHPSKPWFSQADHRNPEKSAIVIGGGLAGCSTAYSLAKRGWQVTILEQHEALASEASGNPQGVLYAKLSADNTPLSQFIFHGYHYSIDLLKQLNIQDWQQCGVVQLAVNDKTNQRYQALDAQHPDDLLQYMNAQQLSEIAGLDIHHSGLFFPNAGWVHPPAFCRALVDHPTIKAVKNSLVNEISPENNEWVIKSDSGEFRSKTVIIAQGTASNRFNQLHYLPLKSIRGQITRVKATPQSQKLSTCVCGEGYIAPAIKGEHTLGATFHFNDSSLAIRDQDHQENLSMQQQWFPTFYDAIGGDHVEITGGRTGFRCTTPDYLPIVGPVVHHQLFLDTYAPLRKNSKLPLTDKPDYFDGLYVTTGHGSRGMISCPISGEILADMITGDESNTNPLPVTLKEALHPSRFLIRDLIKNKQ
ncbi:FAD-dependent 5-carboxymethylaminomethyl-2-thiouridine(34) oxidoreductase MnmC [uncultured Endozoicomonas sp.]|uniref:FAD-dependent 5-carboxymethylaminomethyl-2-thiouridine(34) oxidoreductase MnmC n=1 Tax=uncultured Endozoicomonas sp. TaxID=432652 RepID=UPI0026323C80|nr:FAD-dependent 5-carboxymethylaminomethyl-2-thiouridine(34) oxidoreductase MnmC [uncultured Endozoicomonas sp.]